MLDADTAAGEGFGLWADAKAGHSRFEFTRAGSTTTTADHRDMLAGLQWQGGGFSILAGGGVTSADVGATKRGSKADVKSTTIGGQMAWRSGRMRLTGGAAFAWHDIDTDRSIAFPGFTDHTVANQDGRTRTLYAEAAYQGGAGGMSIEPFLGVANQRVHVEGTVEEGGDAALMVGGTTLKSTMTELGVRLGGAAKAGSGGLYPVGTVAWQHLFGDRTGAMTAEFDIGSDPFDIRGAQRSRNALRVNAGLGYRIKSLNIGLSYDGRLAGRDIDHGLRLTAAVKF
jgi:outer membrane autotransporter protein